MQTNRRTFLTTLSAAGSSLALPSTLGARDQTTTAAERPRRKIAFLGTVVRTHSHSQHFLDRLAMGYGWGGAWQEPRLEIASVFIDQFPEKGDLARQRVKKYGLKLYQDIENALTLGTGKLAVDGVVIIAEHGDYPGNAKGQKLYPRYDWFKKCVKVFEASGRSVPVFNDKHLSTEWNECVEMVEDAKSPEFVHKLDDPPLILLSKGIHAMVEAKNEKAAAFINTTLHRYLWEPAEFHQEPSPIPMPQLREILFTGIYGLYKINGEYPEEVSKKLEVYADSERFSLLARFICHNKRVLHDLLKYYPVDFVNNFATWSPQTVAKDSQPQVDFKDVSSHDMLKYIREATYIIPQYK